MNYSFLRIGIQVIYRLSVDLGKQNPGKAVHLNY